ncbi:transmembrane protein 180-like [Mytilus galloprovincialis]|uniref:transmembrane protein 180-like n=1 Tax=Mytilus galloprovincialis TaxID=29158 RepID=UPI003F7BFB5F
MGIINLRIPMDLCYGSMSLFLTILHNVFLLYHVDMFVTVYKIDKTSFWIGETVFLIWNSFNDPLFGWLSDSKYLSNSVSTTQDIVMQRLNKLSINGPLFTLTFLMFWFPWGYPWLQFIVCLCLYDTFLTMIDLHHSALLADLAISSEARTKLNAKSSLFSALGSASVFLSYILWDKSNFTSFRIYCVCISVVSLLGFTVMASAMKQSYVKEHPMATRKTESHERHEEAVIPQSKSILVFVKQLMKHKNFKYFSVMNLIQVFHCHFNSNFFPLFLENLLGGYSSGLGAFLIGISFLAPHINNLYFLSLCRKFGVYNVINLLFFVKLLISITMFVAGPKNIWLLCLFVASNRVFTEGTCKLLNLVISDLVDEDFVLHKRKKAVSALMFGTAALVSKPGQTFAPLLGTWLLALQTGHEIFQQGSSVSGLNAEITSPNPLFLDQQRRGIFNMLVYVPIVCASLQLFIWSRFTLKNDRLKWVKSARSGAEHSIV